MKLSFFGAVDDYSKAALSPCERQRVEGLGEPTACVSKRKRGRGVSIWRHVLSIEPSVVPAQRQDVSPKRETGSGREETEEGERGGRRGREGRRDREGLGGGRERVWLTCDVPLASNLKGRQALLPRRDARTESHFWGASSLSGSFFSLGSARNDERRRFSGSFLTRGSVRNDDRIPRGSQARSSLEALRLVPLKRSAARTLPCCTCDGLVRWVNNIWRRRSTVRGIVTVVLEKDGLANLLGETDRKRDPGQCLLDALSSACRAKRQATDQTSVPTTIPLTTCLPQVLHDPIRNSVCTERFKCSIFPKKLSNG